MKAILVVDIPDELEYEELYFDGEIRYTSEFDKGYVFLKETGRCLLKPMPQKKNKKDIVIKGKTAEILEARFEGWNDCLDEILGEEQ